MNAGLCHACLHRREIRSDRGSVFIMCLRALREPEYPKYPRLPVIRCEGFQRNMNRYNWASIPEEQLNPLVSRQVIHTSQMTIARIRLKKGAFVPMHNHVSEQVSMMESGSLRFEVAGEEVTASAGEALHIPSGVPHSALALEDSVATDLFTPPREDWIRGDDSYLRK